MYLREALASHGVEVDHVEVWQTVGKLRRRHGLVMSGEPREPGLRVEDWTWETRRVRSLPSWHLSSRVLEESQIEGCKHEDNADIH